MPRLLLALCLLVPLVPDPGLFTTFDLPKRIVLFAGAAVALLVVLGRAGRSKEETKVPVPENLSLLSLLVAAGLFFARRAPDARLTFLTLAEIGTLSALGILAARYLADDRGARRAFGALVLAGAAAAVLGIVGWPFGLATTFGNRSFAAEFMAGAVPLALVLVLSGRRAPAIFGGVSAGAMLAFMALAWSRADILGLAAGLAVAGGLWWLSRRSRRPGPGLLAAIVLALAIASPFAIDALSLPTFGRSDTVAVRTHIRSATLEMALDHAGGGVGLGGFRAAYPAYRHPEETALSLGREVSFPHDLTLLVFAETGVFGLLFLLLFLWSVLYAPFRTVLKDPDDRIGLGAAAALVAILVSAQFSAPLRHPGSALLFFLVAGIATTRRPRRVVTMLKGRYRRIVPVVVLAAPVVVGLALLPPAVRADLLYARAVARERANAGEMDEEVRELLARSAAAAPTPEALRQLALYDTLSGETERALARLDALFAISPHDVPGRIERARALLAAGRAKDAAALLDELSKARPDDGTVTFLRGLAELRAGRTAAAVPPLLRGLKGMPPDAAGRNARQIARELPAARRDSFLAQVALWPEADRSLAVLSAFPGDGDYYRAVVLVREDRLDAAMDALRRSVEAGAADPARLIGDPRLAPLRARADFDALLR